FEGTVRPSRASGRTGQEPLRNGSMRAQRSGLRLHFVLREPQDERVRSSMRGSMSAHAIRKLSRCPELFAVEGDGLGPGVTGFVVGFVAGVELGGAHEAVADAGVDGVLEVDLALFESSCELPDVVHADAGILVAPEADEGSVHAAGELEWGE